MKKFAIFAMILVSGVAFASSLNVPWFVDNALQANTTSLPPAAGVITLVYLHNNQTETITCAISYFNQEGINAGTADGRSTFTINPNASLAFRPVMTDSNQEALAGQAVPNRSTEGVDTKKNGSIVVQWVGAPTDVQGTCITWGRIAGTEVSQSTAYLLPPGA